MKTAQELLKEKLIEIGADGLCWLDEECGCSLSDFIPCESIDPSSCVAAKNNSEKAEEMGVPFWMQPIKTGE